MEQAPVTDTLLDDVRMRLEQIVMRQSIQMHIFLYWGDIGFVWYSEGKWKSYRLAKKTKHPKTHLFSSFYSSLPIFQMGYQPFYLYI